MTDTKKSKRKKDFTVEELYQNKNFVHPKEKNLETIFEEPKQTKDGHPILTSTRRYRRYLDFDPTSGKIQKRKKNAKKCVKKLIGKRGKTRSITKAGFDIDLVLEAIDNSSDDSLTNISLNQSDCKSESSELDCSFISENTDERENINLDVIKVRKEDRSTPCDNKDVTGRKSSTVKTKVKDFVNMNAFSDKCACLKTICCCTTTSCNTTGAKVVDKSNNDAVELIGELVSAS